MAWGGHRSQLIISGYSLSLSLSLARANISHPSDGTHGPEAWHPRDGVLPKLYDPCGWNRYGVYHNSFLTPQTQLPVRV